jgi:hypothetical protein
VGAAIFVLIVTAVGVTLPRGRRAIGQTQFQESIDTVVIEDISFLQRANTRELKMEEHGRAKTLLQNNGE